MDIPDYVGLVGVAITLIAYLLLQVNWMRIEGKSYSLLNAIGSLLILYSLYYHWNTPAAVIELAWLVISLFGLGRLIAKAPS